MNHFYSKLPGHFNFETLYTEMVGRFPDGARFVEVGVWCGRSLSYLLVEIINSGKSIALYAVDPWDEDMYEDGCKKRINNADPSEKLVTALEENGVSDRVQLMRMTSELAVPHFENESLDFVFIDGSHKYEDVRNDIRWWLPKVRIGGVIAGHDYPYMDVRRAVNETFGPEKKIIKSSWVHEKGLPACVEII